jgi:hypothetical protein
MTGSEIRSKRMAAGIPGAIVCARAGIGRNRLSDIERKYIIASDEELARLGSAITKLFPRVANSRSLLRKRVCPWPRLVCDGPTGRRANVHVPGRSRADRRTVRGSLARWTAIRQ